MVVKSGLHHPVNSEGRGRDSQTRAPKQALGRWDGAANPGPGRHSGGLVRSRKALDHAQSMKDWTRRRGGRWAPAAESSPRRRSTVQVGAAASRPRCSVDGVPTDRPKSNRPVGQDGRREGVPERDGVNEDRIHHSQPADRRCDQTDCFVPSSIWRLLLVYSPDSF